MKKATHDATLQFAQALDEAEQRVVATALSDDVLLDEIHRRLAFGNSLVSGVEAVNSIVAGFNAYAE